eukprot:TRINITY_DN65703_c4_g2_i1.p1 TRINITY_DN65703_c4_g2~~TRINITY_DN65703_c4_g2_i1.p1  ORF type:complete len:191 (+),score=77.93 TRINITY_DN65703_c4_g2_i1:21-593(+)
MFALSHRARLSTLVQSHAAAIRRILHPEARKLVKNALKLHEQGFVRPGVTDEDIVAMGQSAASDKDGDERLLALRDIVSEAMAQSLEEQQMAEEAQAEQDQAVVNAAAILHGVEVGGKDGFEYDPGELKQSGKLSPLYQQRPGSTIVATPLAEEDDLTRLPSEIEAAARRHDEKMYDEAKKQDGGSCCIQ